MDLELLQFRSCIIQGIRRFFSDKKYLELDTPALSATLIPETCLEVFKTEYIPPFGAQDGVSRALYLVPSPEVYIKRLIAEHKMDVFQVSKCYRNVESIGRIHSPEFTMLEYYTMGADYRDSLAITEALFAYLLSVLAKGGGGVSCVGDVWGYFRPPFVRLTMDDAFLKYAGFRLSECGTAGDIARQAVRLGIDDPSGGDFLGWAMDDLYELILVHQVEPNLPVERPVFLLDYPNFVPCLARDRGLLWKERWELYVQGIELANCYTEETDAQKVRAYFKNEGLRKQKNAQVCHAIDSEYWKIFTDFPACSGVAMGVDRLIAVLGGYVSIEPIMPFWE